MAIAVTESATSEKLRDLCQPQVRCGGPWQKIFVEPAAEVLFPVTNGSPHLDVRELVGAAHAPDRVDVDGKEFGDALFGQ